MIANEREFKITQAAARRLESAIAELDAQFPDGGTLLHQAMRSGYEGDLEKLRAQMVEFESLSAGHIHEMEAHNLDDVVVALMRARVALGVTQSELAAKLAIHSQQVQRYEATRYAGVSVGRLQAVMSALGVSFTACLTLPAPEMEPC